MYIDFLLFAGVSVQIRAVSSTFHVTDYRHAFLVCCDIFSSIFLILNDVWKFKTESSSLGISKYAPRITLIVPVPHQFTGKQ